MPIVIVLIVVFLVAVLAFKSIHLIGPAQVGLVNKRFALRKLPDDNPIAFRGEAGYQAELLTPDLRCQLLPLSAVPKVPRVPVRAALRARNICTREAGQSPRLRDDDPAARKGLGLVQEDARAHAVAEEDHDHGPDHFRYECFWFHAHSLY